VRHENSLRSPTTLLNVPDSSAVGDVRRFCQTAAEELGFDEVRAGKAAIVATELATNLVRHARGGDILVQVQGGPDGALLRILAIDRGPGMRDIPRCLEDGFSTGGGPGNGLGAVRRLCDLFDIHSVPGVGSAVLASFSTPAGTPSPLQVGALSLPFPGETACGDAWDVGLAPERCSIAVIDGLGHGADAATAAATAVKTVSEHASRGPERTLEAAHNALKPTRGAAMAMAEIDVAARRISYAGVGNIVAGVASGEGLRRMVSYDGTLGHEAGRIQAFEYPLEAGQTLIMHSDGLRSQWKLDRCPGLLERDPFLVAGLLYRDLFKGRDDATVVVARMAAA
jgi:anti-sigma regulatory factor (Ser/Thr protein kinase)